MSLAIEEEAAEAETAGVSALETSTTGPSLLRFITCGSVDDGKSTLIGRLLYDSKAVFDDQLAALGEDSRRFGTQGDQLDLALLVDGLSAEREQGITIDVAYRYFATSKRSFIVADTPGHEQYTRNMATGASTAELAVILIDARKGILPQTRRHSFIVSMLGVRHVAVAVNKMDLVEYDQATFERICSVYRSMAAHLGFTEIAFFPISARDGDNVARLSSATPWYRGHSLLEHLETAHISTPQSSRELLFPVQWVNRPNQDFRGYAGLIARGGVRSGDEVVVLPRGSRAKVTRIATADGDLSTAIEGQSVTLILDHNIDVSRGDVIAPADSNLPIRRDLKAKLLWTGDRPLAPEEPYFIKLGSALAQARVSIEHTVDIHSFGPLPTRELAMNGIAVASITLDRELVVLPYRDARELGGFILIDKRSNETVAFGLVDAEQAASESQLDEQVIWRDWLGSAGIYFAGREAASANLREDLVVFAATVVLSAILVFILTRSFTLAVIFAVLDAVLRPLARSCCRKIFAARAQRQPDELNSDGAGI
jgi:bifunctional enzyme CysN/CysC